MVNVPPWLLLEITKAKDQRKNWVDRPCRKLCFISSFPFAQIYKIHRDELVELKATRQERRKRKTQRLYPEVRVTPTLPLHKN
jgi:hypothetical protein